MDRLINGIFYTMKAGESTKKRPVISMIKMNLQAEHGTVEEHEPVNPHLRVEMSPLDARATPRTSRGPLCSAGS